MSMGGAIYSTSAFNNGGGRDNCDCCGPCLWGIGIGIMWMFCCPCASYYLYTDQNAQIRADDERRKREIQFYEELEAKSGNLCWACNLYILSGDERAGTHKTREFGMIKDIVARGDNCHCCSLLAKLLKGRKADHYVKPVRTSWGITIFLSPWCESSYRSQIPDGPSHKLYKAKTPSSSRSLGSSSEATNVVKSQIDWRVPKNWLAVCQNHHADSCENRWESFFGPSSDTPGMRLVDVNKMTIFMLAEQPGNDSKVPYKYAVLSYTWGDVQKTKIEQPSRRDIDLTPYYHQLPQTIKDAIITTREMGLDYLWVDALCIQSRIEGDAAAMGADEQKQFKDMHKIYGRACFCIVAAGGESARDGLWDAVRDPEAKAARQNSTITRKPRPAVPTRPEFIPPPSVKLSDTTSLAVPMPLPGDISKCKWASRAWCLQEQLFSTRYLIFFDNQMYFQCKKRMWFEDMSLEKKKEILFEKSDNAEPVLGRLKDINIDLSILDTTLPTSQHECVQEVGGVLNVVRSPVFAEYQSIVSLYSTREMTDEGDAINAVDGLLSVIRASMRTEVIFGLPESMLDAALLWRGTKPLQARQRGTESSEATIPSWSWAGWTGYVGYDKPVKFDPQKRELVSIELSNALSTSYLENIRPFVSWFKPGKSSDPTKGSYEALDEQEMVNGTGLGIRTPDGKTPADWDLISTFPGYKAAYDILSNQTLLIDAMPTHLHLLTMCIVDFTLITELPGSPSESPDSSQQRYITLPHDKEKVAGEMWLDGKPHQGYGKASNTEALIVISSARYFKTRKLNETSSVYTWPQGCFLYNILLVELVEKVAITSDGSQSYTVAYRKGVGRISKDSWASMNSQVRYIRLG
jgi:hypothetical protein